MLHFLNEPKKYLKVVGICGFYDPTLPICFTHAENKFVTDEDWQYQVEKYNLKDFAEERIHRGVYS